MNRNKKWVATFALICAALAGQAMALTIDTVTIFEFEQNNGTTPTPNQNIFTQSFTGGTPYTLVQTVGNTVTPTPPAVQAGFKPITVTLTMDTATHGLLTLTSTGLGSAFDNVQITLSGMTYTPSPGFFSVTLDSVTPTATQNLFNPALPPVLSASQVGNTGVSISYTPGIFGVFATNGAGQISTFDLNFSEVPEPREWAAIVLFGAMGLIVLRKFRNRLTTQTIPA